jgi:hypothetical protein
LKTWSRAGAALAVLVLGGLGLYFHRPPEVPGESLPPGPAAASTKDLLPSVALCASDVARIVKIELTQPDDDDKSKVHTITLEKLGGDWEVTSPLKTRASASKVTAALENLQDLTVLEVLPADDENDEDNDLTDGKALHVVAWTDRGKAVDLHFGKTIPKGQLVKTAQGSGLLVIANSGSKGYSGFLFTRRLRSWRETSILHFHADDALRVEITNKTGFFSFARDESSGPGSAWVGSLRRRDKSGKLGSSDAEWTRFDPGKVDDFLGVYDSLGADDFGTEEDRAASGVDDAEQTGGVVHIELKDGKGDWTLRIGGLTKSSTRWALADSRWAVQVGGDGTLYALSPWTAGWAVADASRFEKTDGDGGKVAQRVSPAKVHEVH